MMRLFHSSYPLGSTGPAARRRRQLASTLSYLLTTSKTNLLFGMIGNLPPRGIVFNRPATLDSLYQELLYMLDMKAQIINRKEKSVARNTYNVNEGLCTLQMFFLLNPQMNTCKPNPKTTSSDFNRLESVTKIFCFHAISKYICLLFQGSFELLFIILLNDSAVFTPFYL